MNSRRRPTRAHTQKQHSTSNNTQSRITHHNCVELKNDPARSSLKRKKSSSSLASSLASSITPGTTSSGPNSRNSEKVENRVPAISGSLVSSSSRQSSGRVFAAMGRPPSLEPDLLIRVSSKKDKVIVVDSSKHPLDMRPHRRHNDVNEASSQHSNIPVERHMFTGPLAVAEYERMKKEIETLKENLHESKRLSKRQTKQLEESKAEASAAIMAIKERDIELVDVKTRCRKNEELLSTIEVSVQCQICMDLPDKPFALSPCGHVLCLSCLQEWFRKAPPALDDMDVDPDELTDPQYILMRSKTCPSCRAVVKHRPVPIFMIKSVVTVFKKAKSSQSHASGHLYHDNSLNVEDNPWKGIFASSEEDEEEESHLEFDSDDLGDWYRHAHFDAVVEDTAATESEMENEEDEEDEEDDAYDDGDLYIHQRWAPPSVSITPADYDGGDGDAPDTVKLLQRGCSWDMLQNFDISYSHDSGIVVALRSLDHLYALDDEDDEYADNVNMHRVFLGWNIALQPGDMDGEDYMEQILREIKDFPERWQVTPTPGSSTSMDARRLVFVDEAEEFDTTDTEAWFDNEDP